MGDTPKKTSESNSKCFICSSIPTSKNKVYLFEKTSTDLAGIIRSLVEFDVKKCYKDTNLRVWRWSSSIEQRRNCKKSNKSCWVSLKIGKVLGKKETANDNGDVRVVNAAKCLRFSTVGNIQPSPEAFSARFYRELWRHRERENA